MATATFYTGRQGSLLLDGNTVAQVQSWSVSTTVSLLNVRTLQETDDRFFPESRTTSGSCRILYYGSGGISSRSVVQPSTGGTASTFINKILKARDGSPGLGASLFQGDEPDEYRSDLRLKVDDGTADGLYIEMRILITNLTLTMTVGEIFAADITFQSSGAPTFVNI